MKRLRRETVCNGRVTYRFSPIFVRSEGGAGSERRRWSVAPKPNDEREVGGSGFAHRAARRRCWLNAA